MKNQVENLLVELKKAIQASEFKTVKAYKSHLFPDAKQPNGSVSSFAPTFGRLAAALEPIDCELRIVRKPKGYVLGYFTEGGSLARALALGDSERDGVPYFSGLDEAKKALHSMFLPAADAAQMRVDGAEFTVGTKSIGIFPHPSDMHTRFSDTPEQIWL